MVAAFVFANADARAWYLGHNLTAPLFALRLHITKTTINIRYCFGPDLICCVLTQVQLAFLGNLLAYCLLELVMKFSYD